MLLMNTEIVVIKSIIIFKKSMQFYFFMFFASYACTKITQLKESIVLLNACMKITFFLRSLLFVIHLYMQDIQHSCISMLYFHMITISGYIANISNLCHVSMLVRVLLPYRCPNR